MNAPAALDEHPALIEVLKLAEENKRLRRTVSALEGIIDGLKRQGLTHDQLRAMVKHTGALHRECATFEVHERCPECRALKPAHTTDGQVVNPPL